MEFEPAILALAALAQPTRLEAFRLLVRSAPEGLAAGAVADRLGAQEHQLFINVDKFGNTSAASVAIALDQAVEQGRIERGDLVLLVVFGAGLTWGAAVIEW